MLARMNGDASKETARTGGHPGVIAPPLAIYLAALAAGLAAHWLWRPWPMGLGVFGISVGALAFAAGGAVVRAAMNRMRAWKTTVNPYGASTAVVSNGVFAFSRNPIYVGMTVALAGLAWAFDTVWLLAVLAVVLPVMHWGVIKREERYLIATFGDPYRRYLTAVRRWV